MNEIVYSILLVSPNSPTFTTMINYGLYVCIVWYLWLIAINQIDFAGFKEKIDDIFTPKSKKKEKGLFEQ